MRGHKRQRGKNRWELSAYIGYDPEKRRRIYRYKTVTASSARAADSALADFVHDVLRERAEAAGRVHLPTVEDAVRSWFRWEADKREPSTRMSDRSTVNCYILPWLGDVDLSDLRGDVWVEDGEADVPELVSLSDIYRGLLKHGGKHGQPLSRGTVLRVHGLLGVILEHAVARGWLESNPARRARLPKRTRRASTTPSGPALAPFLRYLEATQPALCAAVHIMNSGARRVDLALRWSDYNPGTGELILGARGLTAGCEDGDEHSHLIVAESDTSKRRFRKVALDHRAVAALRAHRVHCVERALRAGVTLVPDAYVFSPVPDGSRPYRPEWVSHEFHDARDAAIGLSLQGLEDVRLYDIRHFMATELLAVGVPPPVVAERMGSSLRTMDHFYRHAMPAADRMCAQAMDKIWDEAEELSAGPGKIEDLEEEQTDLVPGRDASASSPGSS